MKLYRFDPKGDRKPRPSGFASPRGLGVEHHGNLVDIAFEATPLPSLEDFLYGYERDRAASERRIAEALERGDLPAYSFDEVKLLSPVRPWKILCSGINYRGHLQENPAAKLPDTPFYFSKLPSAVIGPGEPIVIPALSRQVDYEVELAVVIGRRMRRVPPERAMEHVFGYTVLNDVSARDVQFKDSQITLGKNFDTFAPVGPCVVTADEVPDVGNLRLRTLLNGQVMQDGSTADWVFPLPELLSFLSRVMTLNPGDLVSTGTPAGVGCFRNPPVYLKPGDTVVVEVEGIGRLENPVVAEDAVHG